MHNLNFNKMAMKKTGPRNKTGSHRLKKSEAHPIFVDLRSDFGFKKVFGQEDGKKDLIRMLNAFLNGDAPKINTVQHLDREKLGVIKTGRTAIFDVYVKDQNGCTYDIEMQNRSIPNPINRQFLYLCSSLTLKINKGPEENYDVSPSIGIFITNFNIPGIEDPKAINFIPRNCDGPKIPTLPARIWTVELPKFNKKINELENEKDVYLFLLKNMAFLTEIPEALDKEKYRPLFERARIANLNTDEMDYYKMLQRQEETQRLEIVDAFNRGEKCGEEKGEKKGELKTARQIAVNMLNKGCYTVADIADISALSVERIEQLQQELFEPTSKKLEAII